MSIDDARSFGLRLRLRRLLACVCLLGLGASHAQTIESVLAPGPVIKGHAKVEHDCKACHLPFNRTAQDALCTSCHKEVGRDILQHTGLHGRHKQQTCRACHTEHRGRDAKLAAFDQKTFDHGGTDFALHDKHVGVACEKCHLAGKRWREAADTCVGCHSKDDPHAGGLGPRCEDCHSARGWSASSFDHDTKTRFALTGKHGKAKCDDCHAKGHFKDTPRACVACHRKDDEHKGRFGDKCETCHGSAGWKPSTFDHDTATKYPLKDKHRELKCNSCHKGMLYEQKLETTCVACHAKDDKHKGNLGRQCADCHSERGWKDSQGFDHARTRFPLLGAHAKTACKDCHTDTLYRQTPRTCVACHRKDDKHQGNLGEGCAACHRETRWQAVDGLFDHDKTHFPLRHAHAAPTVTCRACHASQHEFRNTATACIGCHRKDDKHEGNLGERCDSCHTDAGWRVERFDHTRTRFALAGQHLVVACKSCHLSLRFKEAPRDCIGCHRKDDRHKGTLGASCANCHNVRAWPLWEFNHDLSTRYRLEGKHRGVRCESCHVRQAPASAAIAPLSSNCAGCHRKDDPHEGRFGQRCEQCHVPAGWHEIHSTTAPGLSNGS
jgi:hypothetical protein